MKKLFLVLAIAAVSAVSASAQTSIGVGYVDGALTGFSKLETSGELSDVTLSTTGFYVEGMMNVPISDGFSFVPGVRYIYGTNSGNKNFTFSEDFVLGGSGTARIPFSSAVNFTVTYHLKRSLTTMYKDPVVSS